MAIQDNKPIYRQIADSLMDGILAGTYVPDGRMPSVREHAAATQVNANTVLRAYDQMERDGVIYNKRGLGYFVAPDAASHIRESRRREFYNGEAEYFFSRLQQLGVTPQALRDDYESFLRQ